MLIVLKLANKAMNGAPLEPKAIAMGWGFRLPEVPFSHKVGV